MGDFDAVIQSIINGDKTAFAVLYDSFSDKVYNTAVSYVQDAEMAEDITQEVFVKVYRNLAKFKKESSLSTWIYRITINTAINYTKKKKRITSIFDLSGKRIERPDFEHPGVLLEQKENAKILMKCIQGLIENQKTAFILSFIEELPRQEVADIMGVSLKSVEALLQRAKKNLRKRIERDFPDLQNKKGKK